MWSSCVVLCALLGVSLAAVALAPLEPKPEKYDKVEGCYVKALDRMIPFGQTAPSKMSCMQYRCSTTYLNYETCGAVVAKGTCKIIEDKSKPYPDCCKKIQC